MMDARGREDIRNVCSATLAKPTNFAYVVVDGFLEWLSYCVPSWTEPEGMSEVGVLFLTMLALRRVNNFRLE